VEEQGSSDSQVSVKVLAQYFDMMEDENNHGPARGTRSRAQATRPYEVPQVKKKRRRNNANGESETDTQPSSEAEDVNNDQAFYQPDLEIDENSVAEVINLNLNEEEEYERNDGDQTLRNLETSLADELRAQTGVTADIADLEQFGLEISPSRMHPRTSLQETTQTVRKSQQRVSLETNEEILSTVLKQPAKRPTPASPTDQVQVDQELLRTFETYMPEKAAENRRNASHAQTKTVTAGCATRQAPPLIDLEEEPPVKRNRQKSVERQIAPPPPNRSRNPQVQRATRNIRETSKPRWHPNLFGSNVWVRERVQKALITLRIPEPSYDDEEENDFIHKVMLIRDGFEAKWNETMHETERSTVASRTPDLPRELPKQDRWHITPPIAIRPPERKVFPKEDFQQNQVTQQRKEIERLENELKLSQLRAQIEKTKLNEGEVTKTTIGPRSRSANRERRTTLKPPTRKIKVKRPSAFSETEYEEAVPKPTRVPRVILEHGEEDDDSSSSNDERASQRNEEPAEEQQSQALVPYQHYQRALPKHLQQKPMPFANKFDDDFNHFIAYFETCAKHNGWDDRAKIAALSIALRGDALDWYQQQAVVRERTFQQWKQDMTKAFVNRNTKTLAKNFLTRNQFKPMDQSVDDYCRKTVNACERVYPGMDNETKVTYLLDGIRTIDGYDAIAFRPPEDPEEFRKILNNWLQNSNHALKARSVGSNPRPIVEIPQTDVEGDECQLPWPKYDVQIEELDSQPYPQKNGFPQKTSRTYVQVQNQRAKGQQPYEFTTYCQNEQFVQQQQPQQNGQQMNTPPKQFTPANDGNGNNQNGQNRPYQPGRFQNNNSGYNNNRGNNSNGNFQNSSNYPRQNAFSAPRQNGYQNRTNGNYQNQQGGNYQQNNGPPRQPNGGWQNNNRPNYDQRNQQYPQQNRGNGFQNRSNGNGFNNNDNARPPFRNQQQNQERPFIDFAAWQRNGRIMCRRCGGADHTGRQCQSTGPTLAFMSQPTEQMWTDLFQRWPNPPMGNNSYQNGGQSKNQFRR